MQKKKKIEETLEEHKRNFENLKISNRGEKTHHRHILEVARAHIMTLEWVLGETTC